MMLNYLAIYFDAKLQCFLKNALTPMHFYANFALSIVHFSPLFALSVVQNRIKNVYLSKVKRAGVYARN